METDYFKVNTGRQSNSLQMQGGSSGPTGFANLMQCILMFFSLSIFRWPHSFLLGWCLWWFHCAMSLELSLLSVSSWACLMGASFALWLLLPSSWLGLRMSPRPSDSCLDSCQCLWQLVLPLQVSVGRVCSCECASVFAWLLRNTLAVFPIPASRAELWHQRFSLCVLEKVKEIYLLLVGV